VIIGGIFVKRMVSIVILALLVSLFGVSSMVSGATGISVTIDGKLVNFPDAKPFIDANGRTLIPVRFVTEDLGATVEWKEKLQEVYITKNNVNISVRINDRDIIVNNQIKMMDTKAIIKDSRTYVPIRYVAEALGAKVGWNASTKTVIITTGSNSSTKSYEGDFYKINPSMPEELYTYEYKKRRDDNWYATNKWMVNRYGLAQVTSWMNIAKNYMETCYTVDYRTYNKEKYIDSLKWYFMPGAIWYGGDGVGRPILKHLEYWADKIKEKQIVMKMKYITDPSLVVSDGHYLVRGRAIYTIESCNDMKWLNDFLFFGNSELGKENIRDFDIELANLEQKDGWEHSVLVLYNENLLSVIK
jgi:hypothetical protein